jgi:hypothetical protein
MPNDALLNKKTRRGLGLRLYGTDEQKGRLTFEITNAKNKHIMKYYFFWPKYFTCRSINA